MQKKRILAAVMSLCMVAGAVSYGAPVISNTITAQAETCAEGCYSFDVLTGTLTLMDEVNGDAIRDFIFKENVKTIVASEGTILPEDCRNLFYNYINCTSIDLSKADTINVVRMENMFACCSSLTSLDISGFDTSNVETMYFMFAECSSLASLDVSGFDTSNVISMCGMFDGCSSLTSLDVGRFDTSKVENMCSMFEGCSSLTSLDVSGFDTSKVEDMGGMFENCSSLTALDVSGFDTSKVTAMYDMFYGCSNLTSLDLSRFDTSKVRFMEDMFRDCSSLTELDLSSFDTSNVYTNIFVSADGVSVYGMNGMFAGCSNLTALDLSNFDTGNVTNFSDMFRDCSSLTELDLSSFDTSKIYPDFYTYLWENSLGISGYSMNGMFAGCSNLNSLDLRSFDTSNIIDFTDMFSDCNELRYIILGENFKNVPEEAHLINGDDWVKVGDLAKTSSGDGEYAIIENEGSNEYVRFVYKYEPTYPTNIKVEYSKEYHQVRFTWDKVEGADRYGIAVYLAGKWRVQTQTLTNTTYTSPKNLTPGKSYRVAIAARVNGKWDTANAIKHSGTVTIK
ncbi:BspA family leucine-rich repeat surface protein [Ruminococcus albus]|uniref:Surface protein n=1 Tax=Ruminococcus albus TaxID=1264 RepID=A0A1I1FEA3_RUMAL|nr:BspA family leucine-rich repeat surface protein [Ruminococcus albus]SFB97631.1 surface protein [Ruminococcus albus]